MPRPKRQKTNKPTVEVLIPEDTDQPKTQTREVKHKTEWVELQPVEETLADDEPEYEEIDVDGNPKPRKKNERDELRKALAKNNVTPASNLRLSIDRYLHSDAAEGGNWAETEFLTKYVCTKEHITSEDYLDVARKWGPGLYRFTLRMNHSIVTAWDKRLGVANTSNMMNAGDPSQPIFISAPDNPGAAAATPIGVLDPRKLWKEHLESEKAWLEIEKLKREAYGLNGNATTAPTDPKIAALQLISENPDVMERIGKGIASTVLGAKVTGDEDPWAAVVMEAIKSGQAAEIAATIIREIMAPFRNMGANNGQAQMAPAAVQNQPQPIAFHQSQNAQARNEAAQTNNIPGLPNDDGGLRGRHQQNVGASRAPAGTAPNIQAPQATQNITPADALMLALIDAMARNAPLKEAQSIINVAVYRNPELDESIDELLNLSTDELMNLLKAYHPKVDEIPHAKEWLEALTGSLAQGEQLEASE